MWNAIQKYGWENFTTEIIAEGLSYEEACRLEILLIQYYNSTNKDFGYNISEGGSGNNSNKLRQSIIQYTLDGEKVGEYQSIREASRQTGITYSLLHNVVNRKRKTASNFIFRKKNEPLTLKEKEYFKGHIIELDSETYEVVARYKTITEAIKATGRSYGLIKREINNYWENMSHNKKKLYDTFFQEIKMGVDI